VAEDVRIKVTLETQQAERDLQKLKRAAGGAAQAIDQATGGDGSASGTKGRVPAARSFAQRSAAGGSSGIGGALPRLPGGSIAGAAIGAILVGKAAAPAFSAIGRPGGSVEEAGAGLLKGTVDLLRWVPIAGQSLGAVFDRTVGTALDAREQAIRATSQATSGLAAAGIQVDQNTLSQINAVQMTLALRQVRNEAAARRAAPGILDSVFALGLE